MSQIKFLEIQFENPKNGSTFNGGDTILGAVVVETEHSVNVQAVYVLFLGESHTFWVNKTSDKIYESQEQHFNARIDLPYLNQNSDGELLSAGCHRLPFNYQLPLNLPSSIEGEYGYTRYSATARIELSSQGCFMPSGAAIEFQVDKTFIVCPLITDQSYSPADNQPLMCLETVEMVGCMGRKGVVEIELLLAKPGFRIGDTLIGQVSINNMSRTSVKNIQFMLIQQTKFQAVSRYESVTDLKEMNRIVEVVPLERVNRGESKIWPIYMTVPQTPPSQIGRIIAIAYWAKLICKDSIELTLPVDILSQFGEILMA